MRCPSGGRAWLGLPVGWVDREKGRETRLAFTTRGSKTRVEQIFSEYLADNANGVSLKSCSGKQELINALWPDV